MLQVNITLDAVSFVSLAFF